MAIGPLLHIRRGAPDASALREHEATALQEAVSSAAENGRKHALVQEMEAHPFADNDVDGLGFGVEHIFDALVDDLHDSVKAVALGDALCVHGNAGGLNGENFSSAKASSQAGEQAGSAANVKHDASADAPAVVLERAPVGADARRVGEHDAVGLNVLVRELPGQAAHDAQPARSAARRRFGAAGRVLHQTRSRSLRSGQLSRWRCDRDVRHARARKPPLLWACARDRVRLRA
jgi:hypothetical protein